MTPDETKRGRELIARVGYIASDRDIDAMHSWLEKNSDALLTLAETHAKDVHHAYVEGWHSGYRDEAELSNDAWDASQAKKKLEGHQPKTMLPLPK